MSIFSLSQKQTHTPIYERLSSFANDHKTELAVVSSIAMALIGYTYGYTNGKVDGTTIVNHLSPTLFEQLSFPPTIISSTVAVAGLIFGGYEFLQLKNSLEKLETSKNNLELANQALKDLRNAPKSNHESELIETRRKLNHPNKKVKELKTGLFELERNLASPVPDSSSAPTPSFEKQEDSISPSEGEFMAAQVGNILSIQQSKKVAKAIQSLKAEEIDAIARSIVGKVMSQFDIDVSRDVELPGLKNIDIYGKEFPVYGDRYNPESEMMTWLLPQMVELLQGAFSTPSRFIDEGLQISLLEKDGKGLLDADGINESLSAKIKSEKDKIIWSYELNSLSFKLYFKLNQEYTKENDELTFDLFTKMNGVDIGHTGGTLQQYQKQLTTNWCF